MTNTELIQAIRNEIGKHLDALNKVKHLATFSEEHGYNHGFEDAMRDLLSFLSTLESEKPVPSDLKEAADEMAIRAFPEKKSYSTVIDRVVDYNAVDRKNYRDGIIAGAKWDRQQMLKEAVEGVVMDFSSNQPRPQVDVYVDPNKYCTGDKVRVIVIPNTDEK